MKGEWLDWGLGVLTTGLVALLMALGEVAEPGDSSLSLMEARSLEFRLKLADAGRAFPEEFRQALGITEGADAGPSELLEATVKETEEALGWSREARILLVALALGHDQDEVAAHQLEAARALDKGAPRQAVLAALDGLLAGRSGPESVAVASDLKRLGASRWLAHRLTARAHRNAGEAALAEQALTEARASAEAYLVPLYLVFLAFGLLIMAGMLVLLVFPFVRRPLEAAGHVGLADTPSGFETHATYRVFFGWTLGYVVLAGMGLSALYGAIDPAGSFAVGHLALQTGLHGALAFALIQAMGRKESDARPLFEALRLAPRFAKGGLAAIGLWAVAGLAAAIVIVLAAQLAQAALFGSPAEPQRAIDLFAAVDSTWEVVAFAGVAGVLAPLVEECLFRGFLYRNLRDMMGVSAALAVSGLAFALVHMDAARILPLAALGAWLAYLFQKSGSLLVPVLVHMLWNLGQLALALGMSGG